MVVPGRPVALVRAAGTDDVRATLQVASAHRVPVVPRGAGTGLSGGSAAIDGCITLSTERMRSIEIDAAAMVAVVQPGLMNAEVKNAARAHGLWYPPDPSSFEICSIGGNLATNAGGICCVKYGVTTDYVLGIEVVLADGTVVRLGGRTVKDVAGYDLKRLFVGSEGTLGVITEARLRIHPLPKAQERRAFGFTTFLAGLEACRRILRRGATPAVLRLYDQTESARNFEQPDTNLLIVLDEADPDIVAGTLAVVDDECSSEAGAHPLDDDLVQRWLEHRNDVSALAPLWRGGIVVDTVEVSGPWAALPGLFEDVVGALTAIDGTLAASAHQSHAYTDGACLYFTFAGRGPDGDAEWRERYYRDAWDAVTDATLAHHAAISHHHGIGLNRSRFLPRALGSGFDVLRGLKTTFDPHGILNPGKFGLSSPFGPAPWA
jgi:alkyldihydroxyacetonephosphate synthase